MAKKGTIGSLLVEMRADLAGLKMDVKQVEKTFQGGFNNLKSSAVTAGKAMGAALVAGLSVSALTNFGKGVVQLADRLEDLGQQTRFSAQLLSGMKSELENAGTSVDSFARGIFTAQRTIGQIKSETDPAARAIAHLKLNLDDLRNFNG